MKVQRRFVAWVSLAALWLGLLAGGGAAAAPALTLSQNWGPPTLSLTVKGTGFPANTVAELYFDYMSLTLAATDGAGAFSRTVKVPSGALPGTHWITAYVRATGVGAQKSFTVRTPWRQFHGPPRHNGWNPFENILSPSVVPTSGNLDLAWSYSTGGSNLYSASPVMNYYLYFAAGQKLYCLNPMTGVRIWDSGSAIHGAVSWCTPAAVGGRVFIAGGTKVYAFNANTGAKLWDSDTTITNLIWASPTFAGNAVYVGTEVGKLYALDAATGAKLWDSVDNISEVIYGAATVHDGRVYVGAYDQKLHAFDQASGAKLWDSGTIITGAIHATPAVASGRVFVGALDNKLHAFNAYTGAKLWDSGDNIGGPIYSSPAVVNNRVYVGANDGKLHIFNARTGVKLGDSGTAMASLYVGESSPAVANNVIYVANGNRIYAFDVNGTCLWSGQTGGDIWGSPMVANGKVYVASDAGRLYCFDTDTSPYLSPLRARQAAAARRPDMAALVPDANLKLEE